MAEKLTEVKAGDLTFTLKDRNLLDELVDQSLIEFCDFDFLLGDEVLQRQTTDLQPWLFQWTVDAPVKFAAVSAENHLRKAVIA